MGIKSFRHKGLEEFFLTGSKRGIRPEHAVKLADVLDVLNRAVTVNDMAYPGSLTATRMRSLTSIITEDRS